jgi:hypothetical protein
MHLAPFATLCTFSLALVFSGCSSTKYAPSEVETPGVKKSTESAALEHGAAALQNTHPVDALNMYLDGFHFYADDLGRQVEAHHFCSMLNDEVHQCVIFDANNPNAKLIGIEYIISERLFRELPDDEKKFWHSHDYEVKSGALAMPSVPTAIESKVMTKLSSTYGKTWHTWQVDRGDRFPLGIPQLMMGFTRDGQLDPAKLSARDSRLGISTEEKKTARQTIPAVQLVQGANAWERGETVQLEARPVPVKGMERAGTGTSPGQPDSAETRQPVGGTGNATR